MNAPRARRHSLDAPNVLLVVLDTARRDAFATYGGSTSTPVIDALARRGVALDAWGTGAWTVPGHVALLGGRLSRSAGLPSGGTPADFANAVGRMPLLTEHLHRKGFRTLGVSCNPWVDSSSGFGRGFDRMSRAKGSRPPFPDASAGPLASLAWDLAALRARADSGAAAAQRLLEGWIDDEASRRARSARPQPTFWFANLLELHAPLLPRRPHNDLGRRERLAAGRTARQHLGYLRLVRAAVAGHEMTEHEVARLRRLYAAAAAASDALLGAVLDRLDAAGVLDDTLVIVTSDHGENLGEEGMLGHSYSLDERLLRVPLVAAGPGAEAFAKRAGSMVSLADVPALVCEAAGIDAGPFAAATAARADGIVVAQFDAPVDHTHHTIPETRRTLDLDEASIDRLTSSWSTASDGRWKLWRLLPAPGRPGSERFVDLQRDPLEVGPRTAGVAAPLAVAAALRTAIDASEQEAELAASATPWTSLERRTAGPTGPRDVAELHARMRSLGYA